MFMHKWYVPSAFYLYTFIILYCRLAEVCDSLLQVEKLTVASLTLWILPLVCLVLSRYQPCLAWIPVKSLMVNILRTFIGHWMLIAETDASIAELRARAESISSCNSNNIPVASDCYGVIPEPTSVTYYDYDDPFAMVDNFSGTPHISRLSPNAWVGCGPDIHVLECLGKGYIRLEPNTEGEGNAQYTNLGPKTLIQNVGCFRATYTEATMHFSSARQLKLSPFMRRRLILTADTLSDALKGCDTYAVQKVLRGSLALGYGFVWIFYILADLGTVYSGTPGGGKPLPRKARRYLSIRGEENVQWIGQALQRPRRSLPKGRLRTSSRASSMGLKYVLPIP